MFPRSSHFIPSGMPSSITPVPTPSKNMRPFEIDPPRARLSESGHAPVPRIGEVDRARRVDTDVVRAVELLALELVRDDLARSVCALADERARHVLTDEQVQVGVIRHPVALVREV